MTSTGSLTPATNHTNLDRECLHCSAVAVDPVSAIPALDPINHSGGKLSMWKLVSSLAVLSLIAAAQSGNSTITGTVKDATGSVVLAAHVRVVNEQTGANLE